LSQLKTIISISFLLSFIFFRPSFLVFFLSHFISFSFHFFLIFFLSNFLSFFLSHFISFSFPFISFSFLSHFLSFFLSLSLKLSFFLYFLSVFCAALVTHTLLYTNYLQKFGNSKLPVPS